MEHYNMNLTLKIWRQKNRDDKGRFETYEVKDISSEMSFLEMIDVLNEKLINEGADPVAFDHDCREGICGACSMHINGRPHGPWHATTTCQLHMRAFKDGDTIVVEPWRANAFPVIKDLVVDRTNRQRDGVPDRRRIVDTVGCPQRRAGWRRRACAGRRGPHHRDEHGGP